MSAFPPSPPAPVQKNRPGRISNSLVALSSAAVLAVYAAGYFRTKPAADRLAEAAAQRRTVGVPPGIDPGPAVVSPSPVAREPVAGAPPAVPAPPAPARATDDPSRGKAVSSVVASVTPSAPDAAFSAPPAPTPVSDDASSSPPSSTAPATPTAELTTPAIQPPPPDAVAAPSAPPRGEYNDGTYDGWGYSRHGDIQASVVVEGGRIVSAVIAQCRTRYSCSWVEHLPGQVVSRQRAHVDVVSGATESTYAYEDAVTEALAKAK